jgi:hypothetical protein
LSRFLGSYRQVSVASSLFLEMLWRKQASTRRALLALILSWTATGTT